MFTAIMTLTPWPALSLLLGVALLFGSLAVLDPALARTGLILRIAARRIWRHHEAVQRHEALDGMEYRVHKQRHRYAQHAARDLETLPDQRHRLGRALAHIERIEREATVVPELRPEDARRIAEADCQKALTACDIRLVPEDHEILVAAAEPDVYSRYHRALEDAAARAKQLAPMREHWRAIREVLEGLTKTEEGLRGHPAKMEALLERYENLLQRRPTEVGAMAPSALKTFAIAAVVLTVAVGAAAANFTLLSSAFREIVYGAVGSFNAYDLAAGVIVLADLAMGFVIAESRSGHGIFRTFSPRERLAIGIGAGIALLLLVGAEAGLACTRVGMAADAAATDAKLGIAGGQLTGWAGAVSQLAMGSAMPLVLALCGLALDPLVGSLLAVLRILIACLLQVLAAAAHIGSVACHGALAPIRALGAAAREFWNRLPTRARQGGDPAIATVEWPRKRALDGRRL